MPELSLHMNISKEPSFCCSLSIELTVLERLETTEQISSSVCAYVKVFNGTFTCSLGKDHLHWKVAGVKLLGLPLQENNVFPWGLEHTQVGDRRGRHNITVSNKT